jgi:hypothetical protein
MTGNHVWGKLHQGFESPFPAILLAKQTGPDRLTTSRAGGWGTVGPDVATLPAERNIERAQNAHNPEAGKRGSNGRKGTKVGSSGRIRTYNPPVNSRMLYP